jgi:hypothetical protein
MPNERLDVLMSNENGSILLVGLLPNASRAETLLNNLSEAEFDLNTVSVVMLDVEMRDKIAKDAGPFKGVNPNKVKDTLLKSGLAEAQAGMCAEALTQSKVLVAMDVPATLISTAREMFEDEDGEVVGKG